MLIDQALEGALRGLLRLEELEVKGGRGLLHLLQSEHALVIAPQGLGQGWGVLACPRGSRGRRRNGSDGRGRGAPVVGAGELHGPPGRGRRGRRRLLPPGQGDRLSQGSQAGQDLGQIGDPGALPPRGVDRQGRELPALEYAGNQAGQTSAGSALEEQPHPRVMQALNHAAEFHGTRDLGRQHRAALARRGRIRRRGFVGVDVPARRVPRTGLQLLRERPLRPRHGGAVKRRGNRQRHAANASPFERRLRLRDVSLRSRENTLCRRVLIGQHQPRRFPAHERRDILQRRENREHSAAAPVALRHKLAAQARKPHQVRVGQHAGDGERRQLAVTVAAEAVSLEAEGLQDTPHAKAKDAERRLRIFSLAQPVLMRLPFRFIKGREWVNYLRQPRPRAETIRPIEHAERLGKLADHIAPHPHVLRALARKQHSHPRGGAFGIECAFGQGPGSRVRTQPAQGAARQGFRVRPAALEHQAQARRRVRPEGLARGMPRAPDLVPVPAQGQGRERRGDRPPVRPGHRRDFDAAVPIRGGFLGDVLLQDRVEIAPAKAEGAHPGAARVLPRGPGALLGIHVQGAGADVSDGAADLDGRRQDLVMEGEGGLDEPGRARGRLGVADLGLHRTDRGPGALAAGGPVDLGQGLDLGGVAHRGPGAVALDELDGRRGDPGQAVGLAQGLRLALGARRVDGLAPAVGGGADALEDGIDAVTVAFGVGETLENHEAEALAQGGAVRARIEGAAFPGRREGGGLGEAHEHEDVVEAVHAPGHDHGGAAAGQLQGGQVQGRERARAGGVHHAVGAAQVEAVGDPPRDDVAQQAGE